MKVSTLDRSLLRIYARRASVCTGGTVRQALSTTPFRRASDSNAQTGSSGSRNGHLTRRAVTIASDDGRVRWSSLSRREKAARTTQQSFNFLTILTGVIMTGGVFTFLYLEVFSPDSKTSHFNRAVDQVRRDPRTVDLLGSGKKIKAFGEPTWNRWARARPIASTMSKDRSGMEHLQMHFNVEGPLNKGVVRLHMTKRLGQKEFEYRYLVVDVAGQPRIYLENADAKAGGSKKADRKFLGVRWS